MLPFAEQRIDPGPPFGHRARFARRLVIERRDALVGPLLHMLSEARSHDLDGLGRRLDDLTLTGARKHATACEALHDGLHHILLMAVAELDLFAEPHLQSFADRLVALAAYGRRDDRMLPDLDLRLEDVRHEYVVRSLDHPHESERRARLVVDDAMAFGALVLGLQLWLGAQGGDDAFPVGGVEFESAFNLNELLPVGGSEAGEWRGAWGG